MIAPAAEHVVTTPVKMPRVALAGAGWIGRNRTNALLAAEAAELVAIADPDSATTQELPDVRYYEDIQPLLNEEDLDGLIIATPSALHAEQAIAALEKGLAVFCEKPLGRNAAETRHVLNAAHAYDRLLDVDLSYRHTEGMVYIRRLIQENAIGDVYAINLTFHNAYGPGNAWFYNRDLSGGGCLIDLGTHLIDLALWSLDFPDIAEISERLFSAGKPLSPDSKKVEDFAVAQIDLTNGAVISLSCSWNLPVGQDAVIEASFYGTEGGLSFRNVGGSYYDFITEQYEGRTRHVLAEPPDDWGGRAILNWAQRLDQSPHYRADVETITRTAEILDALYHNA